jgi:hypothetical protein
VSERKVIGDSPNQKTCDICGTNRALTGSGQLYALAVRGPTNTYVRRICEDCVGYFNTTRWPRVKKALRNLRRVDRLLSGA